MKICHHTVHSLGIFCVWMWNYRSNHFEGSVLMLVMTHISLNISHSVGVLAFPQQRLVRHWGRFKAQVQVKALYRERSSESGESDVCLGLCAKEEVILLSKAKLWKYSAQMAAMSHVTRLPPFLLDDPHQLALLSAGFSRSWNWCLNAGRQRNWASFSFGWWLTRQERKIFYFWSFSLQRV